MTWYFCRWLKLLSGEQSVGDQVEGIAVKGPSPGRQRQGDILLSLYWTDLLLVKLFLSHPESSLSTLDSRVLLFAQNKNKKTEQSVGHDKYWVSWESKKGGWSGYSKNIFKRYFAFHLAFGTSWIHSNMILGSGEDTLGIIRSLAKCFRHCGAIM